MADELSNLEREFIEFRAVQEERYKSMDRRLLDIRDEIKSQEKDTDAQSAVGIDLNNRVTKIEAELRTSRRYVAILVTVGSGVSAVIATLLGIYLG